MSTIEAPAQPVVQPVTRADVLHRAADLLEEFGWCQDVYAEDATGGIAEPWEGKATRFCLAGATARALYDFGSTEDCTGFHGILWLQAADLWPGIDWNDQPGRTKAEVVARLRAAANTSPQ